MKASTAARIPVTEVVVIGALHHFHARVSTYGFAELGRTIEATRPHVLALELTAEDLACRRRMQMKREYPEVVYPLLDKQGYAAVALEPGGNYAAELADIQRKAEAAFLADYPKRAARIRTRALQVIEDLLGSCNGPLEFNSPETDQRIADKHTFQYALYPPAYREVWEAWNSHFLQQILSAAAAHPFERIAVIVGLEHCYWLRPRLAQQPRIRLREVSEFVFE